MAVFQIGLESSDSSFLFQAKKSKAARSGTQAGQHSKNNYELLYIVLVSELEHKAKLWP
jgi:hypothetical protein